VGLWVQFPSSVIYLFAINMSLSTLVCQESISSRVFIILRVFLTSYKQFQWLGDHESSNLEYDSRIIPYYGCIDPYRTRIGTFESPYGYGYRHTRNHMDTISIRPYTIYGHILYMVWCSPLDEMMAP
jgi:hypothetical protein